MAKISGATILNVALFVLLDLSSDKTYFQRFIGIGEIVEPCLTA
jgi:hypothetical protein